MNKILRILFVMYILESLRPHLCRFALALLLGLFASCASTGSAHETDNFYLPLDVELADLGDFFGTVHTWAIEEAVAEVNERIEQASAIKDPAARARRLEQCHDPDAIASAVASQFGNAFTETYTADRSLRGSWAERAYPGKKASHVGIK